MKTFAWLRVITYINLVLLSLFLLILLVQLVYALVMGIDMPIYNFVNTIGISSMLLHTILTISIQRRFYPDKSIDNAVLTWWRAAAVVSWIYVALIGLGMILVFVQIGAAESTAYMIGYVIGALIAFAVIVGLIVLQLIGGFRLVRTIQENHKLDLENSFL